MTLHRRLLARLVLCLPWAAVLAPAAAQTWPDKPIRVILPFPPGGPSDIVMRLAAEKMQLALKQPIVIENKPGAGGNLGTAEVARAAPDGHTWLWITDTVMTVNPHVYKNLGFKPEALMPVTVGTSFNQTLVCNPAVGVKTLAELVAKAKSSKLSYASGGAGVPGHLAMELLAHQTGVTFTHVPFRGSGPAVQALLGNQVDMMFDTSLVVGPHIQAGRLRPNVVTSSKRLETLPEVPTNAEAGQRGFDMGSWRAVFAPAGTPQPIVDRLHAEIMKIIFELLHV
jgi:tripartite-type tricarboxylate transporter receptor subunit TctC